MELDADPERTLVAQAVAGNERACRTIFERYHGIVYAVVRGIAGNREDAEDVVQDSFVKIFRGLPSFRGESALSTWIYRIARNEALNAAARSRVEALPIDEVDLREAEHRGPAAELARTIAREHLDRMIGRLEERQRVAIELRYMGGKSYEEIASIMDIPLGTVKTYIYRAKSSLKAMLAGSPIDPRAKGGE